MVGDVDRLGGVKPWTEGASPKVAEPAKVLFSGAGANLSGFAQLAYFQWRGSAQSWHANGLCVGAPAGRCLMDGAGRCL